MALGGGCEILLHSSAVQAHAESYIGLVECGVGVLPGWGGCKEMLTRWQTDPSLPKGPMPAPSKVFETVSTATVSKSAAEAQELHFLRPTDGITMNRDRLLADAKAKALALAESYVPPKPVDLTLPGPSGKTALVMAAEGFHKRGIATKHDLVVAAAGDRPAPAPDRAAPPTTGGAPPATGKRQQGEGEAEGRRVEAEQGPAEHHVADVGRPGHAGDH
eukprot:gene10724-13125_t